MNDEKNRTYCDYLTESKIAVSDFFIEQAQPDKLSDTKNLCVCVPVKRL